jgi:two-component system cell cycle sensor histidine kinase/response regulator CckA
VPEKLNQPAARAAMRTAADRLARLEAMQSGEHDTIASLGAMKSTLHDLHVHQIELEMQNDELQQVREALEVSRKRYFDLYDLAPVGYLTIGENGIVKEANLTLASLLGVLRAEIVRQRVSRFILPEDQDIYYLQRKLLLQTGKPQVCELRLMKQGHGAFWARMEASLVRDAEGASISHAIVSDISERKQAEKEQAQLQAQLMQAQKMEAVGSLAGGIAHDFNNILTGILGGLSLLELDLDNGEQQRDIDEMKGLVERAANLTHALLGFARRGKNDVRSLDLAHVVDTTVAVFGRTRKDITIQREVAPGLLAVLMDRTQIEQVLLNLFINAGHAMPDGGQIFVRMANTELTNEELDPQNSATSPFVTLAVTDTGAGMDAATQSRIFEPFFTTKDIGKGTGLGLASVYGIIKSHGGSIQVESRLGTGTTFTLQLPATHLQPKLETIAPESMVCGKETILIVDDEEHVRKVCSRMLTKLGYTVLSASGGKQALEFAEQHQDQIALVILDMTMPEMSGSQAYKALHAMAPSYKVLLSSGHSKDGQAQELLSSGCNGFIQKPFNITTLAAKVRETLRIGAK